MVCNDGILFAFTSIALHAGNNQAVATSPYVEIQECAVILETKREGKGHGQGTMEMDGSFDERAKWKERRGHLRRNP